LGREGGLTRAAVISIVLALATLAGCVPFFSFQSARIVPPDEAQATVSVSGFDYGPSDDDEREEWTCFDARGRIGLGRRFDCGIGITLMWLAGDPDPGAVFGADIRYGIWRDHLAVVVPATVILGDIQFWTLQFAPGLVATVPLTHGWDVSVAGRRHLFARAPDAIPMWSYDVGLGIPVWNQWTIRPEVGWMFFGSTDHPYILVGVALETPVK